MLDPASAGALLMMIGGSAISTSTVARRRDPEAEIEAHGVPLRQAFGKVEQHTLPNDMLELLGKLDTPGGGHGGQGSF